MPAMKAWSDLARAVNFFAVIDDSHGAAIYYRDQQAVPGHEDGGWRVRPVVTPAGMHDRPPGGGE